MRKPIPQVPKAVREPHKARPVAAVPPLWSVPVAVTDIPEAGRHIDLVADPATCEAIARAAGVVSLSALRGEFDLSPVAGDGVRVLGKVTATVEQNCVVTLDPMISPIDELIDMTFLPPEAGVPSDDPSALGLNEDDPPETIENGAINLGALAAEFAILGIDPYPRKAGSTFEPPAAGEPTGHPFAALAVLKPKAGQ